MQRELGLHEDISRTAGTGYFKPGEGSSLAVEVQGWIAQPDIAMLMPLVQRTLPHKFRAQAHKIYRLEGYSSQAFQLQQWQAGEYGVG